MKNQVTLTLESGGDLILDKSDIRVVEAMPLGSKITLHDGAQYNVNEDVSDILELIKTRRTK